MTVTVIYYTPSDKNSLAADHFLKFLAWRKIHPTGDSSKYDPKRYGMIIHEHKFTGKTVLGGGKEVMAVVELRER